MAETAAASPTSNERGIVSSWAPSKGQIVAVTVLCVLAMVAGGLTAYFTHQSQKAPATATGVRAITAVTVRGTGTNSNVTDGFVAGDTVSASFFALLGQGAVDWFGVSDANPGDEPFRFDKGRTFTAVTTLSLPPYWLGTYYLVCRSVDFPSVYMASAPFNVQPSWTFTGPGVIGPSTQRLNVSNDSVIWTVSSVALDFLVQKTTLQLTYKTSDLSATPIIVKAESWTLTKGTDGKSATIAWKPSDSVPLSKVLTLQFRTTHMKAQGAASELSYEPKFGIIIQRAATAGDSTWGVAVASNGISGLDQVALGGVVELAVVFGSAVSVSSALKVKYSTNDGNTWTSWTNTGVSVTKGASVSGSIGQWNMRSSDRALTLLWTVPSSGKAGQWRFQVYDKDDTTQVAEAKCYVGKWLAWLGDGTTTTAATRAYASPVAVGLQLDLVAFGGVSTDDLWYAGWYLNTGTTVQERLSSIAVVDAVRATRRPDNTVLVQLTCLDSGYLLAGNTLPLAVAWKPAGATDWNIFPSSALWNLTNTSVK